jgi:outer membrane translocation and assembly module TamA
MRLRKTALFSALSAFLAFAPAATYAQCISKQDHRSNKQHGIVVDHIVLNGTRSVNSTDMADITSHFVGSCFDDSADEMSERIREYLQQFGYFKASVHNLSIKAIDPLARPKPVSVEAQVNEGPQYRLSQLQIAGNHASTAQQLAAQFPIKPGDVFDTRKVRSGFDALLHLYDSEGYLDFDVAPDTQLHSNATVTLRLTIQEGKQYRMGSFDVFGSQDTASLLKTRWDLGEGQPFDTSYIDKFVQQNKTLLPAGFQPFQSIVVTRNCRKSTVAVYLVLDPGKLLSDAPRDTDCNEETKSSSKPTH